MQDSELQTVLERVHDRNSWTAGWFLCGVVSVLVLLRIFLDWRTRDLIGKLEAIGLIAFLILFPATLFLRRKRGSPIYPGWLLVIAYALLMLGVQTFVPR